VIYYSLSLTKKSNPVVVVSRQASDTNETEEQSDSSALTSMVSNWFHRKLNGNLEDIHSARTQIAKDLFNFTFAAFSNSFGMVVWSCSTICVIPMVSNKFSVRSF
jgi:hypothetical protein